MGDGIEAIEVYTAAKNLGTPFDLVILDLTVPEGMGGVETLAKLKKLDDDVVAIAASGYSRHNVFGDPGAFGFDLALQKPFRSADLDAAIAKALPRLLQ